MLRRLFFFGVCEKNHWKFPHINIVLTMQPLRQPLSAWLLSAQLQARSEVKHCNHHSIYFKNITTTKKKNSSWDLRDGSAVKSTACSCKGSGFLFPGPTGMVGSQLPLSPVSGDLIFSSDFLGQCTCVDTLTYM